jgi:hypothetical protein
MLLQEQSAIAERYGRAPISLKRAESLTERRQFFARQPKQNNAITFERTTSSPLKL